VLGQTTDTDDAEGQLLQRPVPAISAAALQAALAPHRQHPPACADLFGAEAGQVPLM
jgi:tRNA pseudouridine55 synthase